MLLYGRPCRLVTITVTLYLLNSIIKREILIVLSIIEVINRTLIEIPILGAFTRKAH